MNRMIFLFDSVHSENGMAPKRTQIPYIPSILIRAGRIPKERALSLRILDIDRLERIVVLIYIAGPRCSKSKIDNFIKQISR